MNGTNLQPVIGVPNPNPFAYILKRLCATHSRQHSSVQTQINMNKNMCDTRRPLNWIKNGLR